MRFFLIEQGISGLKLSNTHNHFEPYRAERAQLFAANDVVSNEEVDTTHMCFRKAGAIYQFSKEDIKILN